MDCPGESMSRVACSSSVRRPRGKPSPRRLGKTRLEPSLDSRLTEMWVVLAHHGAFSCSSPVRREEVDDSRETATSRGGDGAGLAARGCAKRSPCSSRHRGLDSLQRESRLEGGSGGRNQMTIRSSSSRPGGCRSLCSRISSPSQTTLARTHIGSSTRDYDRPVVALSR